MKVPVVIITLILVSLRATGVSKNTSFLRSISFRDVISNSNTTARDLTLRQHDVVHVVTSGDLASAAALVTLGTSIVTNTQSNVMLYFITLETDVESLRSTIESSILRNASYEVIPFSKDKVEGQFIVRSPRKDLGHPLNFARFYLPELLPGVERVAYIDMDCLVLGDVRELYNTRINDQHIVAGFAQVNKSAPTIINFNNKHVLQMKPRMEKHTLIMSAGVFVANLTRWKAHNITQQLLYWMKLNVESLVVRYSGNGAGSQAIMLLALHNKYSPLPVEWNVVLRYQYKKNLKPKLLHWNGRKKPWKTRKVYNAAIWRKYFYLSGVKLDSFNTQR